MATFNSHSCEWIGTFFRKDPDPGIHPVPFFVSGHVPFKSPDQPIPQIVFILSDNSTFVVSFDMAPRIEPVGLKPVAGDDLGEAAAVMFEMLGHNPEMAGFARSKPGVRVLRGPMILAKARRAGCDDRTCFTDIPGLGPDWKATLAPREGVDAWGAWSLVLERGGSRVELGVCDYASAADTDNPRNAFSIWF